MERSIDDWLSPIETWLANGRCRKHGVSAPRVNCEVCRYEALRRAFDAGLQAAARAADRKGE